MTEVRTSPPPTHPPPRIAPRAPALAGIGYAAAWIISLSVGAPNPSVAAKGEKVVAAFAGHRWQTLIMFGLAEGIAAMALVVVVTSAARAAHRSGQTGAGIATAAFGSAVAVICWAQLALGVWLINGLVPDYRFRAAGTVYHAIVRIDGAKMFLLAGMALATCRLAHARRVLPRWLASLGVLLAATLACSGLGFMFLESRLASSVMVSGTLLVVFVCVTGVALRIPDVGDVDLHRFTSRYKASPRRESPRIDSTGEH